MEQDESRGPSHFSGNSVLGQLNILVDGTAALMQSRCETGLYALITDLSFSVTNNPEFSLALFGLGGPSPRFPNWDYWRAETMNRQSPGSTTI